MAINESTASLIVKGPELDIDGISRQLGMMPSHTHRIGDRVLKIASDRRYEQDMWSFKSDLPRSEPIDDHIRWLVTRLNQHSSFLKSLKEKAEVYIVCSFIIRDWEFDFSISSESLHMLTDLGVDLDFSIMAIDSDKDRLIEW